MQTYYTFNIFTQIFPLLVYQEFMWWKLKIYEIKIFCEFFNHTHFGSYKDLFYIKFHIWKLPVGYKYSF